MPVKTLPPPHDDIQEAPAPDQNTKLIHETLQNNLSSCISWTITTVVLGIVAIILMVTVGESSPQLYTSLLGIYMLNFYLVFGFCDAYRKIIILTQDFTESPDNFIQRFSKETKKNNSAPVHPELILQRHINSLTRKAIIVRVWLLPVFLLLNIALTW